MNLIRNSLFVLSMALISYNAHAQDDMLDLLDDVEDKVSEPVRATFKTTRLINAHTIEVMGKGDLDFRVDHRFDNFSLGYDAMWGFDNIRDIRLAFEYGISDRVTVALGRSKGSFFDGFVKYKLLKQTTDNKMPLTMTGFSSIGYQLTDQGFEYEKDVHRLSYVHQLIIARKINSKLSMQLMPLFLHRNLVNENEENNFYSLGVGLRYMFTRSSGIILDFYQPIASEPSDIVYFPPFGIGYEIETGGHVFHVTLTNASYIVENKFIAASYEGWENEDFKFGFNISRVF